MRAVGLVHEGESIPMSDGGQHENIALRVNSEIGARVRALRKTRKLSQGALAELAGGSLSQSHLSELEAGTKRWNIDHLVLIATALGVELHALLPGGDVRENPAPAPALPPAHAELLGAVDAAGPEALPLVRALARALEAAARG